MIQVSICEYFATRIFIKTHRLSPALSPASFDLQRLKVDTIFHPRETKAESASGPAECDGLIDVSIGHGEGGGVIGVAKQWVVSMGGESTRTMKVGEYGGAAKGGRE